MQPAAGALDTPTDGKSDLFFPCEQCGVQLVVENAAAGMTLICQSCGQPTTVPHTLSSNGSNSSALMPAEKLAELQRHLKENESQRTEINGYINQHSIQLHRWQLRLQTLNERNKELTDEIASVAATDDSPEPADLV